MAHVDVDTTPPCSLPLLPNQRSAESSQRPVAIIIVVAGKDDQEQEQEEEEEERKEEVDVELVALQTQLLSEARAALDISETATRGMGLNITALVAVVEYRSTC